MGAGYETRKDGERRKQGIKEVRRTDRLRMACKLKGGS